MRLILESSAFQPLPRLSSVNLLEPLFIHHLARLGLPFDRIFSQPPRGTLPPPLTLEEAALADCRRHQLLSDLLQRFSQESISPVLLVKGGALAPQYPSPALRMMSDVDIVLSTRDSYIRADRVLLDCGWRRNWHSESVVYIGPDALHVDLQAPRNNAGHEILARSQDTLPQYGAAQIPSIPDHLWMIAQHAAIHGGTRIWRDVCDTHQLLDMAQDEVLAAEQALFCASLHGEADTLAAMFRFLNSYSPRDCGLPGVTRDWDATLEADTRQWLSVYTALATESAPPVFIDFVRLAARRLGASHRRELSAPREANWAERDPLLGTLPRPGTIRRRLLQTAFLAGLAAPRYHKLLRLYRQLPTPRAPFSGRPEWLGLTGQISHN